MILQKELKKLLHYDSATGIFTRKIKTANCVSVGDIAGCTKKDGYVYIYADGNRYLAHRLAWFYVYGVWPKQIDHINHIRSDNRIVNLRDTPQHENCKNQSIAKDNKSGVTGVYFGNTRKLWYAEIRVNRKKHHLCTSKDKFEAICCRMSANNKYGFHENHGR